jgi:hypothetical protein
MVPTHKTKKSTLPVEAYDYYLAGLRGMMNDYNLNLEEAKKLSLKKLRKEHGVEHIPFVEAAYKKLKEGE